MTHQIKLTTIELLLIRNLIGKKHFRNDVDCLIASGIMEQIDEVVKRDLPKAEQIKEQTDDTI